ncbi:carbon-nitrogen hydrolase family protein [Vibrio sp. S4M6]|uniref:carbon-nitrogen hydrolase family protein n=1 Tax=Vibrio sinus TaxID=2946865 RepID=UPI00202A417C|nr:carbon-nitrogen hydrolase family protein [Vibrio sinus]MCL9780543.1 carbon-nitrogen hydrolase family protein [Vibrio sinus]
MNGIGIIQMTSGPCLKTNLAYIADQVEVLANQGAQLIVTPENALMFASRADYHAAAEMLNDGDTQSSLAKLAKTHSVWLVIGSFPILHESGVYTTQLVFDNHGTLACHYNKLHMFDVDVADQHQRYRESDTFTPGGEIKLSDSPIGSLGLTICYDLRFPHLYAELANMGAQVILVPAAFTEVTGKAHWEILLRARAIETQCWVVAANQVGQHPGGRSTWGHSMVINPWGEVVAQLESKPDSVVVELDINLVKQVRDKMPIRHHTRFGQQLIEN